MGPALTVPMRNSVIADIQDANISNSGSKNGSPTPVNPCYPVTQTPVFIIFLYFGSGGGPSKAMLCNAEKIRDTEPTASCGFLNCIPLKK